MARNNKHIGNRYQVVDKLPAGAQTVKEYCASNGLTIPAFYMKLNRKTLGAKVVLFQNINFVIS